MLSFKFLYLRCIVFMLFFSTSMMTAENLAYSQSTKLTIQLKNVSVKEVLLKIENDSEFIFVFRDDVIDLDRKVSLNVKEKTIDIILDMLFHNTNSRYEIIDRQVVIMKIESETGKAEQPEMVSNAESTIQPGIRITGTVFDDSGETLPGAGVVVKGTTTGVVTGADGAFVITVPNENAVLVFSFVGFATREVTVGDQRIFDVAMREAVSEIEEVVVVGFGTQKKATITGAISSIGTETLVQSPVANISNSLAGRVTGLLAVQRQGTPGHDESTLRVRGIGTFSGSADPLVLVDGIESDNYGQIDPNEIEDVTILKDASSTAVFGVRGANGVILINTKRGQVSKPSLSISSNVALQTFTNVRKNLGSYDYARYANEAEKYNSFITGMYRPMFTEEEVEHYRTGDDPYFYPNTDWIDLVMKPVTLQTQHNISVRGGTEAMKYFVSAGYLYQEGQINNMLADIGYDPQISYKRFNIRSNFDFNVTKRLSAGFDLASQIDINTLPTAGDIKGFEYILRAIFYALPYASPGVVDGKIVSTDQGAALFEDFLSGYHRNFTNNLTTTVQMKYQLDFITKGLQIRGKVSNWNNMNQRKDFRTNPQLYKLLRLEDDTVFFVPQRETRSMSYAEGSGKNRRTYIEVGVDYNRTFDAHSVTALLLYNQRKQYPGGTFGIPYSYQGLVGRVTYDYKMRYLAEFNIGYNGSENFAPGKRFGWFPAYSLGWIVSEESFFPKNDVVSYIKIRGSYGEVGNDKIGGQRFMYLPGIYMFSSSGSYLLGTVGSDYQSYGIAREGTLGNPDLTWERAKKSNIGMDLVLMNKKIRLTADYFHENRANILVAPATTPEIVGIDLPVQNWGKMKNSGYEAEIAYNDKAGKLNYWVKGNYTFARNKILFQDEVMWNHPYLYRTGQSYGQYFGLIVDGFYNTWEEVNDANRPYTVEQNNRLMPGDLMFRDVNGDGVIDSDDVVPVGYSDFPEIMYGISFGADYKGFDLSVLFQGAARVSRIEPSLPYQVNIAMSSFIPEYSWTYEKYLNGETVKLPHLSTANVSQNYNYQNSTYMVQNAKYLRLKNVEIGYRFQNKLLQRISIASCRIFVNGNNLLTWCGLFPGTDPESLAGDNNYKPYPLVRTFNMGINVQF